MSCKFYNDSQLINVYFFNIMYRHHNSKEVELQLTVLNHTGTSNPLYCALYDNCQVGYRELPKLPPNTNNIDLLKEMHREDSRIQKQDDKTETYEVMGRSNEEHTYESVEKYR